MNAKLSTPEGNELEILAILIEKYEEKMFPMVAPDLPSCLLSILVV